jgi:hypothetical protein
MSAAKAKAPAKAPEKGPDNNKRLAKLEHAAGRWGEPVTASDASDLASALVLVNALKAKINDLIANG